MSSVLLLARFLLAGVFVVAGLAKVADRDSVPGQAAVRCLTGAWANWQAGLTATVGGELTDFNGHVQFRSSKGQTGSQVTQMLVAAQQVQAVLGCSTPVLFEPDRVTPKP